MIASIVTVATGILGQEIVLRAGKPFLRSAIITFI
jgi:hypothetical protein